MHLRAPDSHAEFVKLAWYGPFAWGLSGLQGDSLDAHPWASNEQLGKLLTQAGVYMILGDHPVHGDRALLYIGRTDSLQRRLPEHKKWINEEWRVAIHLGVLDLEANARNTGSSKDLLKRVEALLIFAHSPAYNRQKLLPSQSLRIWNTGRFHRLLPEISSSHPWYQGQQSRKLPSSG